MNEHEEIQTVDRGVERTADRKHYTPPTDILESDDEYVLHLDVPGADPDGLCVTYEDDVLTIRAATAAREYPGYTLAHAEFEPGDFQRAFAITEKVDHERIDARLDKGVLTVRLPKQKPARRRIAVSSN
jgi:HSP20 family molecular chaperone IbpA